MNLDDAIAKDKELKEKFVAAIAAKAQLDAAVIGKTDRCVLGNWLHGEAERKYPFLKSYKPCVEAHTAFHVQAGKVVREINGGECADAQAMIGDNTAYSKAADALQAAAMLLKKEAKL
jgi:methyl-accepting chemotaxis protein